MSSSSRRTGARRREAVSLVVWWTVLALAVWLLGRATGRPVGLVPSVASAALLAAVGETGDLVRRRWTARRHQREETSRLP
ncbi:hypothetical protein DEJ51_30480 [Streptomyces venezuelae]|uniref:Uncharacterized protein n=1 Tax=Streptomyces venezuelae TaxID=54571 RepID=A0A5P2DRY0_STRVZ|nr:hypothetical protein DEJ51_30480 [Streptomyces venezuelae]